MLLRLEKAVAPHSSSLAWKIPWMEEPGRLQSIGSGRVGHDWATSLSLFTFMHWRRKWQPTPVFLPGESQGLGAWWAAICGVAQSRTWLKWLSSSSSNTKCRCDQHMRWASLSFSVPGPSRVQWKLWQLNYGLIQSPTTNASSWQSRRLP